MKNAITSWIDKNSDRRKMVKQVRTEGVKKAAGKTTYALYVCVPKNQSLQRIKMYVTSLLSCLIMSGT